MGHIGLMRYYKNFIEAGYKTLDLIATIDKRQHLTEIGITSELHQNKLVNETKKLRENNAKTENETEAENVYIQQDSAEHNNAGAASIDYEMLRLSMKRNAYLEQVGSLY